MAHFAAEQYKSPIRRSLDLVGVSGSIERKVLAAVGIQFGVSVAARTDDLEDLLRQFEVDDGASVVERTRVTAAPAGADG